MHRPTDDASPAALVSTDQVTEPCDPAIGQHAIVIGGGRAGLRRAAELAGRFRRVTIVEREHIAPDLDRPGDPGAAYLRAHELPIAQVRLLQGCEVTGLLSDGATHRVTGVQLRLQPGPGVGAPSDPWRELHADQVIDTRGAAHDTGERNAP